MGDYRALFDDPFIKAWDLNGKEATVRIRSVEGGLVGHGAKASKKPIISFEKTKKVLAINKTIGKVIMAMYGPNTDDWAGKQITLYPTQTSFGGETVDCIRVRPTIPRGKPTQAVEHREGGEEQQAQKDAAAARVEAEQAEAALGGTAPPEGREPGSDDE